MSVAWSAPAGPFAMGCPSCGAISLAPRDAGGGVTLACATCGSALEHTAGKSFAAAQAYATATLLLLIPANLFPLLTTFTLGASRQSHLISTATAMWDDRRPWVGIFVTLFLIVFPLLRFGLLTLVLETLREGRRPPWLGRAFRWANELQTWAMADVFLLAMLVTYARLATTISVSLGLGAYCFIAAGLLTLFTRASLDKVAVWEAIDPAGPPVPGPSATCSSCGLVLPADRAGRPCPRCAAEVHVRSPGALRRAAALTLAGLLLYFPANLYPIATLPIGFTPTHYTVLEGVKDLIQAKLLGLGLLVLTASFLIPILKLLSMGWFVVSVTRRSRYALAFRSRLFGFVEEIGRWSMIDPFVIGAFVPVMQYNDLITGRAEPAAAAFSGVVVTTMLAARCFDPRLMWDAARSRT